MARAGRGGGGGSRGGSFGGSRSSGSFRSSSSSSRAGRGSYHSSSSRSGSSSYGGSRGGNVYHNTTIYSGGRDHYHGGDYHSTPVMRPRGRLSFLTDIITTALILLVVLIVILAGKNKEAAEFVPREKLDTGNAYDRNVVIKDELDWIESTTTLGTKMNDFYKKTGVQPYFILLDYNEAYDSDDEKEAYADTLYDKYIEREDALLYVYFAEYNPDDVGLTCYVLGKQANSVFDSLALEIWYDSIMKYWYDDISTVDVYTKAYNECARRIMDKPADYSGVLTTLIVVAGGIVIAIIVLKIVKKKAERAKEEAAETERILNTPLEKYGDKSMDDLIDKYDDEE